MKACDGSMANMERKSQRLEGCETESEKDDDHVISSRKRRRICKTNDDLYYATLDFEEFTDKEDSEVEDEEEYQVPRNKRRVARRSGKEHKVLKSSSEDVEKSPCLKASTLKSVQKKMRTKGRRGRSKYTEGEISGSTCLNTCSSGYPESPDSSSTLTSCSPTSIKLSSSPDCQGNNTAELTTNAPDRGKKHFVCHQCKKNDRPAVVKCLKCMDKLYCLRCIRQWYPQSDEVEVAEACPFCQKICNCSECLHSSGIIKTSKREIHRHEKIAQLQYLVGSLFPFVRQIRREQFQEINIEAKIQGISIEEDHIPKTSCTDDERIFCNQCATSIFDVHRSCPSCSYELCLACSQEIREGNLLGGPEADLHTYSYKGFDYVHGGDPLPCSSKDDSNTNKSRPCSEWVANRNGSIPCPSKDRGGCGNGVLELRRILPKGWLRNLEENTESFTEYYDFPQTCGKIPSNMLCKAASRGKSVDNDLYCPSSSDLLQDDALKYFRQRWGKGEPIIVRDSLQQAPGLSWEPMVMWRALCDNADVNIKAVDCLANCEMLEMKGEGREAFIDGG